MLDFEKIIIENQRMYHKERDPFSFDVLKFKREELISLCRKFGNYKECFEQYLETMDLNEKFSNYSGSHWGYYTPTVFEDFFITNRKRPKRLYNEKPNKESYYRYLYFNEELIAMERYSRNKKWETHYFFRIGNYVYSFKFAETWENFVTVFEACYNDLGNISTFANLMSWGEDLSKVEYYFKYCRPQLSDCQLLDYQYYHYDVNNNLDYADGYSRIYNFSPAISGLKLGVRLYFDYDDKGKIIGAHGDKSCVPCIFLEQSGDEQSEQSGDGSMIEPENP